MTALTTNGSAVAATTLAVAGKLFNTTGGTSGNTSTKVGSGTLFKQIFAKGTSTNQTGVSSIPAPTDSNFNGWMWDVTTLEGQLLQAGTLTPTIHLLASTGTTVTPTVQWFKRTSGGVYTQLASVAGSSIALTTSSQALTFTAPSMSDTAFATGDKLCCWLWVNQTAGGATGSTISVVEATSASSAGVASEVQTVTQGYIPIVTTTYSFTESLVASDGSSPYKQTVLADGPMAYYRLDEPSGLTAFDQTSNHYDGTLHGGMTLSQSGALAGDTDTSMTGDGSSGYIDLSASLSTNGLAAFTVEVFVYLSNTSYVNYPYVIGCDNPASTHHGFYLNISPGTDGNRGYWQVGNGTTSAQAPLGSGAFAAATWYHIVAVYDGAHVLTYVNGSLQVGSTALTGTVGSTTNHIYLFNSPFDTECLPGRLDEVAIYAYALLASQDAAHYATGVVAPFTSPVTTVAAFTESLTVTESLLKTDTAIPTESLSASESMLVTRVDIPTDALSATDTALQTDIGSSTESLTATESLLATETDTPVDSLTASDFGNLQAWGIDALTATDTLLVSETSLPTDALTGSSSLLALDATLPVDSLSISESQVQASSLLASEGLTGVSRLLGTDGSMSTDALIVSESVLASDGSLYTEANSASENFLGTGTGQVTESLSISDAFLKADGYTSLDGLTASDSQVSGGAYLPLEGLTGVSSPLEWDVYLPGDDALTADDSASTMTQNPVGGGVVTTPYSFEDDLSITDIFTGQNTSLPTDGLSAADALLTQSSTGFTEAGSVLPAILLAQGYVPLDTLSANDAYATVGAYVPVDALTLLDSLLAGDAALWVEVAPISDSFSGVSTAPVVVAVELTVVIARSRDGVVIARSRDGLISARSRDGLISARSRDGLAVGKGR